MLCVESIVPAYLMKEIAAVGASTVAVCRIYSPCLPDEGNCCCWNHHLLLCVDSIVTAYLIQEIAAVGASTAAV